MMGFKDDSFVEAAVRGIQEASGDCAIRTEFKSCEMICDVADYVFNIATIYRIPTADTCGSYAYYVEYCEVAKGFGNVVKHELLETAEEAFNFALVCVESEQEDVKYSINCEIAEFVKLRDELWTHEFKATEIELRVTYDKDSRADQDLVKLLEQQFEIVNRSKDYGMREDKSKSRVYFKLKK